MVEYYAEFQNGVSPSRFTQLELKVHYLSNILIKFEPSFTLENENV